MLARIDFAKICHPGWRACGNDGTAKELLTWKSLRNVFEVVVVGQV